MSVEPSIVVLETLLARKRRADAVLLSMDGYDRWGRDHDTAENRTRMDAEMIRVTAEREEATTGLCAEVARLRAQRPEVLGRWIDLHVGLLSAFLEANAAPQAGSHAATAAHVARQEIEAWLAVGRGERSLVEENVYYLQPDPARYREAFGIDP